MKTFEVCLPEYWANYLLNGDATGLSDEEVSEIDDYLSDFGTGIVAIDVKGEVWFAHRNDANNIGGTVRKYVFTVW